MKSKKIFACVAVLLASISMAFAQGEHSVSLKGILGFGAASRNNALFDNDTVTNGGFGASYRFLGCFGDGASKFIMGLEPGLEFTFSRTESYIDSWGDEINEKFNTLEIPLLAFAGVRVGKLDLALNFGPQFIIPLGKTEYKDSSLSQTSKEDIKPGVGLFLGADIGYKFTEHHGAFFGYKAKFGYLMEDANVLPMFYLDYADLSLGYRYTF